MNNEYGVYDNFGRLISENKVSEYYGEGSGSEKIIYLYDESTVIGMIYETGRHNGLSIRRF